MSYDKPIQRVLNTNYLCNDKSIVNGQPSMTLVYPTVKQSSSYLSFFGFAYGTGDNGQRRIVFNSNFQAEGLLWRCFPPVLVNTIFQLYYCKITNLERQRLININRLFVNVSAKLYGSGRMRPCRFALPEESYNIPSPSPIFAIALFQFQLAADLPKRLISIHVVKCSNLEGLLRLEVL